MEILLKILMKKNYYEKIFVLLVFQRPSRKSLGTTSYLKKDLWEKVGGFSEEFNPGFASDPDLNMKLWIEGILEFLKVYQIQEFIILVQ